MGKGLISLLLALKMEKEDHQPQKAGSLQKSKEMDLPLEPPKETQPCFYLV